MQLISNWKEGWKFYSVWVFAFIAALPELLTMLSPLMDVAPLEGPVNWLLKAAAIVGIVSRFIAQRPLPTWPAPPSQ